MRARVSLQISLGYHSVLYHSCVSIGGIFVFFSRPIIVHREVVPLLADPETVRDFIMTPDRILDYYPAAIDGGILEPGSSIYCRGKSGISLLEVDPSESDHRHLVVKVTTATALDPPFTAERIKAATFFTMVEDWELEPAEPGTRLTKTWRDIRKSRLRFLPMRFIVRRSARAETPKLRAAWDEAAQRR